MSQRSSDNSKVNVRYSPYNKQQQWRKRKDGDKTYNKNIYKYYNGSYNAYPCQTPPWHYFRRKKRPFKTKQPTEVPRPPSPFSGTEEYTLRKIQETSDMIKRQLMMPPQSSNINKEKTPPPVAVPQNSETINGKKDKTENDNVIMKNSKKPVYNVEEIHEKIITHITNLNYGKKMNLICSTSSGYDIAIQQIQKQKRLELSKVLRDMCSNQSVENSETINSIIPDIGIKIEDLPLEVIQKLSSTLDLNFQEQFLQNPSETVTVKQEICENDQVESNYSVTNETNQSESETVVIKKEICEDNSNLINANLETNKYCGDETDGIMGEVCDESVNANLDVSAELDVNIMDSLQCENNESVATPINPDEVTNNSNFVDYVPEDVKIDIEYKPLIQTTFNNETFDPDSTINTNSIEDIKLELSDEISSQKETQSVTCQTEIITKSCRSQTDFDGQVIHFQLNNKIKDFNDAIDSMLEIDKEILRLTKLKRTIFLKFRGKNIQSTVKKSKATTSKADETTKKKTVETVIKKKKIETVKKKKIEKVKKKTIENLKKKKGEATKSTNNQIPHSQTEQEVAKQNHYKDELDFKINEKILVIKVIQNTLLAAAESGKIFYINTIDGSTSNILKVTEVPITSLSLWKSGKKICHLYVGSFETSIYEYNYTTTELLKTIDVGESVQCLELSWNFIFIGTLNGSLCRYSINKGKIEFRDKISSNSVLVLKATQEGARRVLLIGTRNLPICVRDAMSGLHMRTMDEAFSPSVYSLLLENSLVYCGTTSHDILVFSFYDGTLMHKHNNTNAKGISCLKIVKNLLFASCHNGNIYVYHKKTHQYLGLIQGPGGVILSMEILENIVIVGTMSFCFKSILIPEYILLHNY